MSAKQDKIILDPIDWSECDGEWLGVTSYMIYTIKVVNGKWELEAAGCKEIYDNKDDVVKRVLQDHASRAKQALRIKGWKYEERIGGV